MSDSGFDDDDDELLLQLVGATQHPQNTSTLPPVNTQQQLFQAQGEISILRAQLEALQRLRTEEISRLSAEAHALQSSGKEQVDLLRQTVDKLEDEKRFLGNELRLLSAVKRRKTNTTGFTRDLGLPADSGITHLSGLDENRVNVATHNGIDTETSSGSGSGGGISNMTSTTSVGTSAITTTSITAMRQLQDDWSQLCQHLWQYTINGARRTSVEFLAKMCTETTLRARRGLVVHANTPLLACLWDMLLGLRHLRLDVLVQHVCELVLDVAHELVNRFQRQQPGALVAVPFLISVIHATINFKPSAVSQDLARTVIAGCGDIAQKFVPVLYAAGTETEEAFSGLVIGQPQQRLVENFILVLAVDVLESAVVISTQFGKPFIRSLWHTRALEAGLMQQLLPENTERFVAAAQINLVANYVEVLSACVDEDGDGGFCTGDPKLNLLMVKSLLKVFIIDIHIKDEFLFYGLNRAVGNNHDLHRLCLAVPRHPELVFNKALVSIPYPVKPHAELSDTDRFTRAFQHDRHLLTLRVRTASLLEAVAALDNLELFNLKENIKSMVRIIGYEQNHLIHQPRYELVHMRLAIIGVFVRILFYIIEQQRNINTLIYPETLYEIFVVLLRIAFASDSLAPEAHELLALIRARGATDAGVYNKSCELRSREMAHFDLYTTNKSKLADLAAIEGDFANGLEFPYELDTIEIAREILNVCVNHDEADNLYYNMNRETQA